MGKVAIIIPWFGRELKGGAEQHAWEVATRLQKKNHQVHILTTCCKSFQSDWAENHLAEGSQVEPEGITIHRFPVEKRDGPKFDRINSHLLQLPSSYCKVGAKPLSKQDEKIFSRHLIHSQKLLDYLKSEKDNYDAFLFIPYPYGPIIEGLPIVKEKAFLQPCLHDEPYAYLSNIGELFYQAKSILFISEGEKRIAEKIYGPCIFNKSIVSGAGVDDAKEADSPLPESVEGKQFYLYVGRKSEGKNVPMLVNAFKEYIRTEKESSDFLVLCGHGEDCNDPDHNIIDLGLVSDKEKESLIKNAKVMLQPSNNESFSRVIYESWLAGRPSAVSGDCLATRIPVEESEAGWVLTGEKEWTAFFSKLSTLPGSTIAEMGKKGQLYAQEKVSWENVISRYEEVLFDSKSSVQTRPNKHNAVHQILPNLAYGDAISNFAIHIRNHLRNRGYKSEIYVQFTDHLVEHECTLFEDNDIAKNDIILYHHSIGCGILREIISHSGPKALIYHNITPADFFINYDLDFYNILKKGRAQLPLLAPFFPISVGDSRYNVDELIECGFENPSVLGIGVTPEKWTLSANPKLFHKYNDGQTNLIYISRVSPNKCQHDLIEAFRYYKVLDPEARLFIVGDFNPGSAYCQQIQSLVQDSGVTDSIILTGKISEQDLFTYFRLGSLFWSMSEHEGFGVPLLEAMWFDMPVLAYSDTAVAETMGTGGVLFNDKSNMQKLAALAYLLVSDEKLRSQTLENQRIHRDKFLPDQMNSRIDHLVTKLLGTNE